MKILLNALISSLIISFTSVYAQDFGKITGKVTDGKDATAIEADVKLLSVSDSSVISGAKCDVNGVFSIEKIPYGDYRLEVSFIGYSTLKLHNIKLSSTTAVLTFDTLKLGKGNVTTDEILIEEKKNLIEFSGDKKVFNVDQSILNKGGTALDVLKKVPMVDVDINDNVSLRGSQNVKILIDDKPSRFVSLKQIPADAIERVELITNPPAKYEAEGVTGLINIVMKKSNKLGFTGSANFGGNYTYKFAGWGGVDVNFKKNKWTVFSNLYAGNWENRFSVNSRTEYYSPVSSLVGSGSGQNHGYWIWGQFGSEYEFSTGKTIGFEGSVGTGKWFNSETPTSRNFDALERLISYYTQNNNRNGLWENFTGSLYFNNKLNDKGREITGDITLSRNRNENKFATLKQDYDSLSMPVNNTPLDQRDTTMIKSYNLNVQTDYTHPITDKIKIETGYKGTFRINDNNFNSDTLNYTINNFVDNESVANHFKLNEYINAFYGVFSSSIDKFTYKLGMRVEQTNTKGELVTNGQIFKQNYFDVFPTVNLSQKIGAANQVQLSYSRRITRPNIWRLNPFVNRFNPRFIFVGNPELKPEYTDSYELSLMLFTPVATITPMVFYRQNHDVISNYSYLIDSNISVTTYRNAAGSKSYGMDLLINSNAISWLNLNGTLSLYNTKFDKDLITDNSQEEGFSWKANIRSSFTLGSLFNVELYYTYTGKKVNAQGTNPESSNFDIGISKTFMNDKLTVSLKASDIFKTTAWGQDVNAAGYRSSFRNDWDSRQGSLNLSYRFGNTDEYYQKKKKAKQNNNEGNDQQDSNGR